MAPTTRRLAGERRLDDNGGWNFGSVVAVPHR